MFSSLSFRSSLVCHSAAQRRNLLLVPPQIRVPHPRGSPIAAGWGIRRSEPASPQPPQIPSSAASDSQPPRGSLSEHSSKTLPHHPSSHTPLPLHDGRLQRIDQLPTQRPSQPHQHRLIYQKPLLPIRHAKHSPPNRLELHPNRRPQPAEQHSTGPQHPPKTTHHRIEMRLIPSKMQHRITHHHIRKSIGKWHRVNPRDLKIPTRKPRCKVTRQRTHDRNCRGIRIDPENFVPFTQQINDVAP
jgi:hypothetical protein